MTVIEVSFLTGRYSATSHHDREQSEWPPHGARLFSAMVASWADAEPLDGAERAALEWLEALPPPRISAPEAVPRRVVSHFVPVNDASVIPPSQYQRRVRDMEAFVAQFEDEVEGSHGELTKKAERLRDKIDSKRDVASLAGSVGSTNVASALALLPDGRVKKERYFPSVTLEAPRASNEASPLLDVRHVPPVTYAWDEAAPPARAKALDALLARVTRLGHSSSLVSCRLRDEAPPATHTPGDGALMVRWVRPGQLAALEQEHERHQAIRPRSLPFRGIRYREAEPSKVDRRDPLLPATAGDWIVFELEPRHRRIPMTRTVELARVLRGSVLSHVADPPPEGVSGHLADGTPTSAPHIAFLALPYVGREHADGRIMGLAISLPRGLDAAARQATLRGIGKWEQERGDRPLQLRMGRDGTVEMRRRQPPFALVSLRSWVWAQPSRWWTSATPVALPTHPGDLRRGSPRARARAWARAEEAIIRSCEHVGLPQPIAVRASLAPHLVGARPAQDFPVFRQGRGTSGGVVRRLVHVSVQFPAEVSGPLVLGSGRFMGLGLMRPADRTADRTADDASAPGEESGDG